MRKTLTQPLEVFQKAALNLWERIPEFWRQTLIGTIAGVFLFYLMGKNIFYGVALALVIGSVGILLFEPAVIIYLIVFLIPLNWLTVLGQRLRAITVLDALAFSYAVFLILYRKKRLNEPLVWAHVALLVAFLISFLNTSNISWSITFTRGIVFTYLFGLAMLVFIDSERKLKVVWGLLAFHGIWLSILAVFQSFGGAPFFPLLRFGLVSEAMIMAYKEADIYRASGTFESGPRFALFLLIPFSLTLANAIDLKKPTISRMLWTFATVIILVGLVLSLTRAVFIIIPIIAYLIYQKAGRGVVLIKTALYLLAFVFITTVVLFWALPPAVWDALKGRFMPSGTVYYMDRVYFMYIAFRAFLENPLTGLGIGNFPFHSWDLMQKYPAFWYSPEIWDIEPLAFLPNIPVHNSYFRMLAETSLWGLGAMLAIIVISFRNYSYALRKLRETPLHLPSAAMFACFVGMVIYWFPHEYFLEETYTSILPVVFSAILKKIADNYVDSAKPSSNG